MVKDGGEGLRCALNRLLKYSLNGEYITAVEECFLNLPPNQQQSSGHKTAIYIEEIVSPDLTSAEKRPRYSSPKG